MISRAIISSALLCFSLAFGFGEAGFVSYRNPQIQKSVRISKIEIGKVGDSEIDLFKNPEKENEGIPKFSPIDASGVRTEKPNKARPELLLELSEIFLPAFHSPLKDVRLLI
ncbi:hypothetical protein [Leptospira wolffii]|uniref:hypothetical protein n=1 Tax=Leptospira wolffii TaxID=409998 RepID=UPI0010832CE2|nr:hypothetical protein [Leptospira wolffii]